MLLLEITRTNFCFAKRILFLLVLPMALALVVFTYPNKACQVWFRIERGLASRFGWSPSCANAQLKLLSMLQLTIKLSQDQSILGNINRSTPDATELSMTEYESDDTTKDKYTRIHVGQEEDVAITEGMPCRRYDWQWWKSLHSAAYLNSQPA